MVFLSTASDGEQFYAISQQAAAARVPGPAIAEIRSEIRGVGGAYRQPMQRGSRGVSSL